MDIKRLYGYSVQDLATGIVLADSVEEAREKVKIRLELRIYKEKLSDWRKCKL